MKPLHAHEAQESKMKKNPFSLASNFLARNGLYLFCSELNRRMKTSVRSFFLARHIGAKGFEIGASSHIRGLSCMQIGDNFRAGDGLWLEAVTVLGSQRFTPRIVIGDNVSVSRWSHIAATHYVEIGPGTLIGSKVIITDHNHGQYGGNGPHSCPSEAPVARLLDHDRSVIIGKNVWIGDGAVIMPGVRIGDGAV